jgi:hypothetical protein
MLCNSGLAGRGGVIETESLWKKWNMDARFKAHTRSLGKMQLNVYVC